MPTAAQVGAAPASHVGQVLGLSTSHPPEVDADSGGFEVLRDPGAAAAAMDPGFGILMANILQSGLLHNGDVYGISSQAITAYPGAADGDGAMTTTSLGLMSAIASVVVGHVNKVSHKNPHGITLAIWPFHYIRLCGEQRLHQVHDGNQLVHDPVGHRNNGQQCTWNILLLQSAVSEQLLWSVRHGRLH